MKIIKFLLFNVLLIGITLITLIATHSEDCFSVLFQQGIALYNEGNYEDATQRWNAALQCGQLTLSQKDTLNNWIKKANNLSANFLASEHEMMYVKGGLFKMGHTIGSSDQSPIRTKHILDFYMAIYETTRAQFAVFIKETAYVTTAEREDSSVVNDPMLGPIWKRGITWRHDAQGNLWSPKARNFPVVHISYEDAVAYCNWLSRKTGKNYSLPTEAEWEYAAKGGRFGNESMYSGSDTIGIVAWFTSNSNSQLHPIGQLKPNELGIYDMSGNVWEWCLDWYDAKYYDYSPEENPKGPTLGDKRVARGGGHTDNSNNCRVANRDCFIPTNRAWRLGFRVVLRN